MTDLVLWGYVLFFALCMSVFGFIVIRMVYILKKHERESLRFRSKDFNNGKQDGRYHL